MSKNILLLREDQQGSVLKPPCRVIAPRFLDFQMMRKAHQKIRDSSSSPISPANPLTFDLGAAVAPRW